MNTQNNQSNLIALGSALVLIRSEAWTLQALLQKAGIDDPKIISSLTKIVDISDRMHNVPSFLHDGVLCDAVYLLHNDVKNNWPTGLPKQD